jgi:hypothetical protein
MRKKYMGILGGMLVIIMILPSITATSTFGNKKDIFKNCYIEVTGTVEPTGGPIEYVMWKHFWFRPYGDDRAFVLLWRIALMEPDTVVTIYSEKGGDILWQDTGLEGIWGLTLVWYNGIYTNDGSTDDSLVINMQGNAKVAIVYTDK